MFKKFYLAATLGLLSLANGAMAQEEILSGAFFGKDMAYAKVYRDSDFLQNGNSADLIIGLRDCFVYVCPDMKAEIIARAAELEANGYQPNRLLFQQVDPKSINASSLVIMFEYKNAEGAVITDSFEASLYWSPDTTDVRPLGPLQRGDR